MLDLPNLLTLMSAIVGGVLAGTIATLLLVRKISPKEDRLIIRVPIDKVKTVYIMPPEAAQRIHDKLDEAPSQRLIVELNRQDALFLQDGLFADRVEISAVENPAASGDSLDPKKDLEELERLRKEHG
jgi:hypothetical protein